MPSGVPMIDVQVRAASKPWWRSRTLWLNVLVLLAAAAETRLQLLQPLLPVNVYSLVAFGLPLLNVLLRVVTQQPLSLGAQAPADAADAAAAAAAPAASNPTTFEPAAARSPLEHTP